MLYVGVDNRSSKNHTKHIYSLNRQNVAAFNFQPGGTYGNHLALNAKKTGNSPPKNVHIREHCIACKLQ